MRDEHQDEHIRFRCKACGKRLKVKAVAGGGQIVPCPRCRTMISVPLMGGDAERVSEALSSQMGKPSDKPLAELRKSAARPAETIERLAEIENFWAAVQRLEAEVITWITQLLRKDKLAQATLVQEMHRLGDQRTARLKALAHSHSESMRKKVRDIQKLGMDRTAAGRQKAKSIEWALLVVESYMKFVLNVKPE